MDIPTLTKHVTELTEKPPQNLSPNDKFALLGAMEKLRDALEEPFDKVARIMFTPYDAAALRLGVDMEFFDSAAKKGGPVTTKELAEPKNADPAFVRRIMRILVNQGFFAEQEAGVYTPQPMAFAFAAPSPLKSAVIHLVIGPAAALQSFDYFEKNGYQNPNDAFDGPWQHAHNSKGQSCWDWLAKNPRDKEAFNVTMRAQKMVRGEEWFDFFPVEEKLKLSDDEASSRIALVDIGGGWGHDIKLFHETYPALPGKLVLEDHPSVTSTAESLPNAITVVGHDFLTPQPDAIKHAKAYFFRMVFHDWPDKQAKVILSNLKGVMAHDSLLLINDHVLPETGVRHFETLVDMHMMAQLSALERTEKEWKDLLEGEGFEIRKIWAGDKAGIVNTRLIEASLKK
ncbi:hypothetical protein N0V90_005987 [Kalmusia sp. IMI 367209]|nr:hypothetical protein N0V90_005987 [Kalmusia sp. IMI 367209]